MERRTRAIIIVPMILLFIRIGNEFTFALQQQIFVTQRDKTSKLFALILLMEGGTFAPALKA